MNENEDKIIPIDVFSGTQGEVDFLISLLQNAGITVYLKDSYIGTIAPYISPGGTSPITITVSSEEAEKAEKIIGEYLNDREKIN